MRMLEYKFKTVAGNGNKYPTIRKQNHATNNIRYNHLVLTFLRIEMKLMVTVYVVEPLKKNRSADG